MNVKLGYAAVAILAAFTLGGCGTAGSAPKDCTAVGVSCTVGEASAQTGSNRPAATSDAPAPAVQTTTPSDEPAAFGSTRTYPDGLTVTVSKGSPFQPSETSMGKGKFYIKYMITVVNGTGKVFDPSMFRATAQSSNVEGEQVFDSGHGLDGSPSTKLLKGRESTFAIGFGVADLKDVVLEVTPSFDHRSVLFN